MMMSGLVRHSIIACLLLCASTTATADTVPFTLDASGRPVIQLTFDNETKQSAVIDTAARRTAMKETVAFAAGVERRGLNNIRHASAYGTLRLPLGSLDKLTVFNRRFKDNVVALYPDRSPLYIGGETTGLVGFDVMRGHVFRFNPTSGEVDVWSHSAQLANDGWMIVQGRANRSWDLVLETEFQGVDLTILVATGSSHTLVDLETAKKMFPEKTFKMNFGTWDVHRGLSTKPTNLDTLEIEGFTIGPWDIGKIEVGVTRLRFEPETRLKGKNVMVLGSDVLMRGPIAFDYRNQAVWVPKNHTNQTSR
ncbi:MAG: aspartyl protease family protein [Kordiimonadaceae bacterium]|nr:aspartyl protease family protein [Kordiimonadaceae bacterium]MBO6568111.1 aspartyl protease family protein [Kordiimonadaceae bacterium]MBO6964159.1 aspartyl protease family protein [Kordiimonadaceae bacterium]